MDNLEIYRFINHHYDKYDSEKLIKLMFKLYNQHRYIKYEQIMPYVDFTKYDLNTEYLNIIDGKKYNIINFIIYSMSNQLLARLLTLPNASIDNYTYFYAIFYNNHGAFKMLVNIIDNINNVNIDNIPLIFYLIMNGMEYEYGYRNRNKDLMIKYLILNSDYDFNIKYTKINVNEITDDLNRIHDDKINSVLEYMIYYNVDVDVFKLLLDRTDKVDNSLFLLSLSAKKNYLQHILKLNYINFNVLRGNLTPLMYTYIYNMKLFKLLVDSGNYDVNHQDEDGNTILHYFAINNSSSKQRHKAIDILLNNFNIDPFILNKNGKRAIDLTKNKKLFLTFEL